MTGSLILQATPENFDIVSATMAGSVGAIFPKSRGSGYDAAVNLARQAEHYGETTVGKTLFHCAAFGRTREQVARARLLIRNTRGANGLQVIARGRLVDWAQVSRVLDCYLTAAALDDPRAHCVQMVAAGMLERSGELPSSITMSIDLSAPRWFRSAPETVPFPCRYLLERQFRYQSGHPASRGAQLMAGAVREGCDWCPCFLKNQEGE
ncbi:MAG: hypothetical protein ABL877_10975 [Thiobacillus sp.]